MRKEQKNKFETLIKNGNRIRGVDTPTHDFIEPDRISPEMRDEHIKLMKEYNPDFDYKLSNDFLSETEMSKEFHEIVHDLINYIEVGYSELQTEKLRGSLMEQYNHTGIKLDFNNSEYIHEGLHDASWYRQEIARLRKVQNWLEMAYNEEPNISNLYDAWYIYRVKSEETIKNYESRLEMLTRSGNQPTTAKFDMVEDNIDNLSTKEKIDYIMDGIAKYTGKTTQDMEKYKMVGYTNDGKKIYQDKFGNKYSEA